MLSTAVRPQLDCGDCAVAEQDLQQARAVVQSQVCVHVCHADVYSLATTLALQLRADVNVYALHHHKLQTGGVLDHDVEDHDSQTAVHTLCLVCALSGLHNHELPSSLR